MPCSSREQPGNGQDASCRRCRAHPPGEAAQPRQLVLFELRDDRRPPTERTAASRYREPTFWAPMAGRGGT